MKKLLSPSFLVLRRNIVRKVTRYMGLFAVAGIFLALFATANPQVLTRDAQAREPNAVPSAFPSGVQEA
jgi:hypothetical protein